MLRTLAFACALLTGSPAAAVDPNAPDRAALLQLAARMDQAWTAGDVDANAELFSSDATARFAGDPLGEGRDEIRRQFHGFFKDRPAHLRHVTLIERIELLADNLALWDAEVRVERQVGSRWDTLARIRNVTVAARGRDGWRIQAVRAFPQP